MNRQTPEESLYFPLSMRGTCPDLKKVKLYTDRSSFQAEEILSFDNEFQGYSSVSYFLGSLLSSCILAAIKELNSHDIELDEIEGKIDAQLLNPLRMIPVKGYHEPCQIQDIHIKIYFYADHDDLNQVATLMRQGQELNPVFQLVDQACPIQLEFEDIL